MEWPLNRFDALLIAQTYAGRPMTTHHTVELDGALEPERWARALGQLVADYPELGSRVVGARRIVFAPSRSAIEARLIHELDGAHAALERWLAEPIDPRMELPFRVRVGPGQGAEQAVTLSLHHSVCDAVGALALLDRFMALAAGGRVEPRRALPFAAQCSPPRPRLRPLLGKLWQLRRPAAQLVDGSDPQAVGQRLALRMIEPGVWAALARLTRAAGVSRTTALWHAAATAAAGMDLDDPSRPIRIVAGVDLRAQLGVPEDALGNWLGTLEHESLVEGARSPDPEAWIRLHAALRSGRRPELAALTPALLDDLVGWLPAPLAGAVFRWIDSKAWLAPFSLMLAHIRAPAGRCWSSALDPRRLWCASTLPRKPGLGLTFTTVGDQVCVAATCQAAVLRRETVERFLDALLEVLRARTIASPQDRGPTSAPPAPAGREVG